jgi:hypothetical protein
MAKGRTATANPYGMTTKEQAKRTSKRTNEKNQRKERTRTTSGKSAPGNESWNEE